VNITLDTDNTSASVISIGGINMYTAGTMKNESSNDTSIVSNRVGNTGDRRAQFTASTADGILEMRCDETSSNDTFNTIRGNSNTIQL